MNWPDIVTILEPSEWRHRWPWETPDGIGNIDADTPQGVFTDKDGNVRYIPVGYGGGVSSHDLEVAQNTVQMVTSVSAEPTEDTVSTTGPLNQISAEEALNLVNSGKITPEEYLSIAVAPTTEYTPTTTNEPFEVKTYVDPKTGKGFAQLIDALGYPYTVNLGDVDSVDEASTKLRSLPSEAPKEGFRWEYYPQNDTWYEEEIPSVLKGEGDELSASEKAGIDLQREQFENLSAYQEAQLNADRNYQQAQIDLANKQYELEQMQVLWQMQQAGQLSPYEEQALALRQQELEQEWSLAQQNLQLATQELQLQQQNYLAELRANPINWLQYEGATGGTPVVQPWMPPLMPSDYGMQNIPTGNVTTPNELPGMPQITMPTTEYSPSTYQAPILNQPQTTTPTTNIPTTSTPTTPTPTTPTTEPYIWEQPTPTPATPTTELMTSPISQWTRSATPPAEPYAGTWSGGGEWVPGANTLAAYDAAREQEKVSNDYQTIMALAERADQGYLQDELKPIWEAAGSPTYQQAYDMWQKSLNDYKKVGAVYSNLYQAEKAGG